MHSVDITEQEVGQAEPPSSGVNAIRLQLALRGSQVEEVVGPLDVLITEFKAMITLQPAQVVNDVPGLRNLVLGPPRRRSDTRQAVDLDRRQSTGARSIGNSRQANQSLGLGTTESYADGIAVGVITVEAKTCIVDQGVRKSACPTQGEGLGVDAILCCEVAAADYAVAGPRGILTAQMTIAIAAKQAIRFV